MKKQIFVIFITLFIYAFLTPSYYEINAQVNSDTNSDRIIVKFKPLTPSFLKKKIISSYGINIDEELKLGNTYISKVKKGNAQEIVAKLKKNLLEEYAEEDFIANKLEIPNDPDYSKQWGLTKIQANLGWDISHGSPEVKIAIIDTGINNSHPDLAGKIYSSVNCIDPSCPALVTSDPDSHGTHVAGIAAASTNNNIGVAGTSFNSSLMSVKALNDSGSGYYSWIANGIIWAADNDADVINLSLGGGFPSITLESAINYAWNQGVVIVAAAGNNGSSSRVYPGSYANSIAVASTGQNDLKTSFSNYGSWVDVAAPGSSIYSTYHSGYEYLSGTSMSTPFVSGLAALIKAVNPGWSNYQIRQKIEATSDAINGTGLYWQFGRINVCSALDCNIVTITPTPTPVVIPTATFTPTPPLLPTPTSTPTPTQIPLLSPTPTLGISPTPSPLPWWCKYIPTHPYCQL